MNDDEKEENVRFDFFSFSNGWMIQNESTKEWWLIIAVQREEQKSEHLDTKRSSRDALFYLDSNTKKKEGRRTKERSQCIATLTIISFSSFSTDHVFFHKTNECCSFDFNRFATAIVKCDSKMKKIAFA